MVPETDDFSKELAMYRLMVIGASVTWKALTDWRR